MISKMEPAPAKSGRGGEGSRITVLACVSLFEQFEHGLCFASEGSGPFCHFCAVRLDIPDAAAATDLVFFAMSLRLKTVRTTRLGKNGCRQLRKNDCR